MIPALKGVPICGCFYMVKFNERPDIEMDNLSFGWLFRVSTRTDVFVYGWSRQ